MTKYQEALVEFFSNLHNNETPKRETLLVIAELATKETEKEVVKKKKLNLITGEDVCYYCPKCDKQIHLQPLEDNPDYCPYCGQKLHWEKNILDYEEGDKLW